MFERFASRQRGLPRPLCAPFVGKVFIDDVWSGGSKDGISNVTGIKYPLLSEAIKQGLYHPNCKDSHTTYFEDISTPPGGSKYTADELDELAEEYKAKQKSKQASSQAERMERMSRFSLDSDNKRVYAARGKRWRRAERGFKGETHYIKESESSNIPEIKQAAEKAVEKTSKGGIIEYEKDVKKDVQAAFEDVYQQMTDKFGSITTVSRVSTLPNSTTAYGSYNDNSGELAIRFANKKDCLTLHRAKAVQMKKEGKWSSSHPLHTFRHEIGHAIQAEHRKSDPLWGEKLEKIRKIMGESKDMVSEYAQITLDEFISECIAESMTKKARKTARDVVNIILGDSKN